MGESPLWTPTGQPTNISRFCDRINAKHGLALDSYAALQQWSISSDLFWLECAAELGIRFSRPPSAAIEAAPGAAKRTDGSVAMYPPPRWFPSAELNYAENCLEGKDDALTAVVTAREGATSIERYTFGELKSRVHALSRALRAHGVNKGDRVAGVVCNSIHSITLALATAAIGAIYSSTAPDMGTAGILDRLKQITPKVVFFDNASLYNGKRHDLREKARQVRDAVHVECFVVLPNLPGDDALDGAVSLAAFLRKSDTSPFTYEQVPFDHPLFVMYSSGTTGPPKCIVHGHGGVLLQMKKEYYFHMDMRPGDVYWQYTTTGWMMWQYLITALSASATVVLLDGSPMVDVPGLLDFIRTEKVTHFGTSPRWLSELKARGISPASHWAGNATATGKKVALRMVTSTGSVLVPDLFRHFYASWPKNIQLCSVSGGTDLMACFFLGSPTLPLYAGQLQCVGLGMAAKAYTAEGSESARGEPGELVCDRPFPSQPIYFLSDPGGSKYKAAYYDRYPGIWHHGDFVVFDKHGDGVTVLGRSDGVLNPSGVRFGSAEIYAVLERFGEIEESLCVGQRREGDVDEQVLLFLVLRDQSLRKGHFLTPDLEKRIKEGIQQALSPRHVPRFVVAVDAVPLTINGKKVELVVKQIVSGQTPKVSGTIANRECLDDYSKFVRIEDVMTRPKL